MGVAPPQLVTRGRGLTASLTWGWYSDVMSAHLCHNTAISVIAKDSCSLQWHAYVSTGYGVEYRSSDPHLALSIKLCLVLHSINLVRQMDRQDPVCHWFLLITISWRGQLSLPCDSVFTFVLGVYTGDWAWQVSAPGSRTVRGGGALVEAGQGVELGGRGEHSVQVRGKQAGTRGGAGRRGQTLHCQHWVHRVVCRAPGRKKHFNTAVYCRFIPALCVVFFPNKNLKKNIFSDLYTLWCPNYLLSCLGRVALELEERDLELGPG